VIWGAYLLGGFDDSGFLVGSVVNTATSGFQALWVQPLPLGANAEESGG